MQTLFTQYKHKIEGLTHLSAQIEQREQLITRLRACLAPNMQQALVSAEIQGDSLILIAPSATWATRLRLNAQNLLRATNNTHLRHYHIQIKPTNYDEQRTETTALTPEKPNAEALEQLKTIINLEHDEGLRASLNRLRQVISQ